MSEAVCASCRKPKNQLSLYRSKLDPNTPQFLMCDTCIRSKFEPRWLVIMQGRTYGFNRVRGYINPKRYFGPPILAEDLVD